MPGKLEDLLRLSQGVKSGAVRGVQPGQGQQIARPKTPFDFTVREPDPMPGLPPEILKLVESVLRSNRARDPNVLANAALAGGPPSAKGVQRSPSDPNSLRNRIAPPLTGDVQVRVDEPQGALSFENIWDSVTGEFNPVDTPTSFTSMEPSSPPRGETPRSRFGRGDVPEFPSGSSGEFGRRRSPADQRPTVEEGMEGFLEMTEPPVAGFEDDPVQDTLRDFRQPEKRGELSPDDQLREMDSAMSRLRNLMQQEREQGLTAPERIEMQQLRARLFGE